MTSRIHLSETIFQGQAKTKGESYSDADLFADLVDKMWDLAKCGTWHLLVNLRNCSKS